MDKVEKLIAKAEIEDNLFRYARAIDRRDWDALRDCFHPDAVDEHGDYHGGPEGFIEWVRARHATIPFSMHYMLNCLVEFLDDDTAAVEAYFIAIQRRETATAEGGKEGTDYEVFGRYVDRVERREDGAWRVARRRVVYDSTRTQPSTSHLRTLVGVFGQRDQSDPVYRNLRGA